MRTWGSIWVFSVALALAGCGGAEFEAEAGEVDDAGPDLVHGEEAGILRDSGGVDEGGGDASDLDAGDEAEPGEPDAETDAGAEPNPYGDRVCRQACEGRAPVPQGYSCSPAEGCCSCAPGLWCVRGETEHRCQPAGGACAGDRPRGLPCDRECQCLPGLICAWRDNPALGGGYECTDDPR